MNSLILLHNKYNLNTPKNTNNKEIMDLDNNNEKIYDSIDKYKIENKNQINNSFQANNSHNNIFDLSYIKNKNLFNNLSDSKKPIGKFLHSYKRATKRTYSEAFPQSKIEKNKSINDKNVFNFNINNNNYFYINNKVYNYEPEEENENVFSKHKKFKEY